MKSWGSGDAHLADLSWVSGKFRFLEHEVKGWALRITKYRGERCVVSGSHLKALGSRAEFLTHLGSSLHPRSLVTRHHSSI